MMAIQILIKLIIFHFQATLLLILFECLTGFLLFFDHFALLHFFYQEKKKENECCLFFLLQKLFQLQVRSETDRITSELQLLSVQHVLFHQTEE